MRTDVTSLRPVLVTTEAKGVFFGYLVGEESRECVKLKHMRNCLYWEDQLRGYLGLGVTGPTAKCRVGPAISEHTLFGITGVGTCSPEAVENWELAPWE